MIANELQKEPIGDLSYRSFYDAPRKALSNSDIILVKSSSVEFLRIVAMSGFGRSFTLRGNGFLGSLKCAICNLNFGCLNA